uniref:A-kinase anchor protein 7-like phosphoesterase domain-containing protein n=1 Tax=Trypanosoma vivax (strain Y486) TaxID=1055687 RepID=G0U8R0_TRYVY|nr:conserved hypothetical protein, fragment [Trypanosoma vivax Y486]
MSRCTRLALQKGERGLYFPINHRIVDRRIAPGVTGDQADVQSRYRRELRTSFTTGETRQTIPPPWSAREAPTHFLALRLPLKNALSTRVKEMHESILFSHSQYAPLLVPLARLHITLGVMTVPEQRQDQTLEDIQRCVSDVKGNPHDSYVPHVTVAKIRSSQRPQFGSSIPISVWVNYQHHDFGDVTFRQLDLCRMNGPSDGYYNVEYSFQLS